MRFMSSGRLAGQPENRFTWYNQIMVDSLHHYHHKHHRACPWWVGYLLLNPLRIFLHHPNKLLSSYLQPGMSVLEIGPAMGYFSIPLARAVGKGGQVYCIDKQEKMLQGLRKRAVKAGVAQWLHPRLASPEGFGTGDLVGKIDFALLFWVAHEVPDPGQLWKEVTAALKKGGTLLFSEPKNAVSEEAFNHAVADAERSGLKTIARPAIWGSRSAVLQKIG